MKKICSNNQGIKVQFRTAFINRYHLFCHQKTLKKDKRCMRSSTSNNKEYSRISGDRPENKDENQKGNCG